MKKITLFILCISFLLTYSQSDTLVLNETLINQDSVDQLTESLDFSFYKKRYNETDLMTKVTDNWGNQFEDLYGTRNMRPVLHGVAYRGGANNYYHKSNKRKNQNPLPDDGLLNLCQEGFSGAVYLYQQNFDEATGGFSCNCIDGEKNSIAYKQLDYFDEAHVEEMIKMVHQSIVDSSKGPVYLHCWNGWHASGYISAVLLKQFCGYNDVEAVTYWDLGTDGANRSPHYRSIRKLIRDFKPIEKYQIKNDLGENICPPMPKVIDITKTEITMEQLLIVPEAIPVSTRIILQEVSFEPGRTTIKSPEAIPDIRRLVEAIKRDKSLVVEIGGHTDNSGSKHKNLELSEKRAKFIYDHLIKKEGIDKNRISHKGYGSALPAYSNKKKIGREANRRIEVRIIQKMSYDNGEGLLVNESSYDEGKLWENFPNSSNLDLSTRYVLKDILFEPSKTNLIEENYTSIDSLIVFLKSNKELKVSIYGYTDASGIKEKNDTLSLLRAQSVGQYLVNNGIEEKNIRAEGMGSQNPIADNRFRWGRDLNRRIEIILTDE